MATKLSVPTTSEKLTFVINDFSGGIVNNVNDSKMNDNQSPDMLNMQFRVDGLIQKRPGMIFQKKSPTYSDVTYEISDVIKYEYGAGEYVLIYVNYFQMYYENMDGKPVVIWESPYATKNVQVGEYEPYKIKYVNFNGMLIFTDGQSLYSFSFEGDEGKPTTCKFVNAPKDYTPKEKPAVTGDTKTSEKKGTYKFLHYEKEEGHDYRDDRYTEVDEYGTPFYYDQEGEIVYKENWFYWEEGSIGADYYERWYEPCQYELEDGYKGSSLLPPSMGCIAVHKDRLYVSGSQFDPNMIWVSDILNPFYFPASMTLQTPPTDDYITALHNYNDALVIGRKNSIFALFGNTNRDNSNEYELTELNVHTGMINDCSANKVYHMLFFVGSDGNLYKLQPPTTATNTFYTTQLNTKLDLSLPPFNLDVFSCELAHSIFDSKEGLWYVQIGEHTLIYSYQLMAWTRYNNINAMRFYKIDNEIHFLSMFGSMYKMPSKDANQDYLDEWYDSAQQKVIKIPINAYWISKNFDMGQPARVKQFRDTYVTTECFEDYPTSVSIRYEVDYIDISSQTVIENEIARWDKARFDISKFTSRNIDRSLPLMINRRGRTLRVYYGSAFNFLGSYWSMPKPVDVNEWDIFYCLEDNTFYQRVPKQSGEMSLKDKYFVALDEKTFSQALLVHNITIIYQLKGYR